MLWAIFAVLLILWLVAFIGFHLALWYIHLLLFLALLVLVLKAIGGRRTS